MVMEEGGGGAIASLGTPLTKHLRQDFPCPKGLDGLREVTEPHSFMISTNHGMTICGWH